MTRRRPESGFVLLFVYAMAATVAIMLYLALPRVAFEAQRDKEQLLIDRGQQYSRAIALYVRKFNQYPASFEALESTQNLRFLRKRYIDPITGKGEWRLIHVGPGGVFTDSLIYGPNAKKDDGKPAAAQNFITELQPTGGNQGDQNQQVNLANRLRPSDQAGAPGDPNNLQAALPPPQPDMPQPGFTQPGFPQPGATPQFDSSGQPMPGQPPPVSLPPGIQLPPGVQLPPGMQMPPGQQQNLAGANLIGQLLTSPRPGGLNGLTGQQPQQPIPGPAGAATAGTAVATLGTPPGTPAGAPIGQVIGGGLAGVASKREQEGIKRFGGKKKYNEWEFVYDITKDPALGGGAAIPQPAANPSMTTPGAPAPPSQ